MTSAGLGLLGPGKEVRKNGRTGQLPSPGAMSIPLEARGALQVEMIPRTISDFRTLLHLAELRSLISAVTRWSQGKIL